MFCMNFPLCAFQSSLHSEDYTMGKVIVGFKVTGNL